MLTLNQPIFVNMQMHKNAENLQDILSRWNDYALKMNSISHGQVTKIVCVISINKNQNYLKSFPNLEILPIVNNSLSILKFFFRVSHVSLKFRHIPLTWVSGDLKFSPLLCYLGKFLGCKESKIQIQVHGLPQIRGRKFLIKLKSYASAVLTKIAFIISDSVRFVSGFLVQEYFNQGLITNHEIIISPIPLDLTKLPKLARKSNVKNNKLIFVGRMHEERGANLLPTLLEKLEKSRLEYRFEIVGSGPLMNEIKSNTPSYLIDKKVFFKGFLNSKELKSIYAKNTTLISLAASEGYGLVLREAVLSGLIVVGWKNPGTVEAKNLYGNRIKLFKNLDEAISQIKSQLSFPYNRKALEDLRLIQKSSDHESTSRLVTSWLNLK